METEKDRTVEREPTVVAESGLATALLWTAFTVLGAGLGWLVALLADWYAGLSWAPVQGPAELLASVPDPWLPIGAPLAGAAAGLALGLIAHHEALSVSVSEQHVVLTRKGVSEEFPGGRVGLAFRESGCLVLQGHNGAELAREPCDHKAPQLSEAFTAHGYAWADGDPHAEEFRRWVPDTPGLPEGANALLSARGKALSGKGGNGADASEDVRELRRELAKLGVVVRDEKKRQYWRVIQDGRNG